MQLRPIRWPPPTIVTFSNEVKAQEHAARIIAKDCGVTHVQLPAWGRRNGEPELIYGRDERSWWFRIEVMP